MTTKVKDELAWLAKIDMNREIEGVNGKKMRLGDATLADFRHSMAVLEKRIKAGERAQAQRRKQQ